MLTLYGRDMDNLYSDLSHEHSMSYKNKTIEQWWPYSDENGNKEENSTCNVLRGTDGAQFPPGVKKDDTLWIFNTLPCRSLFFKYVQKREIEGINTLEFGVPLDGANINKTNNVCTCEPLSKEVKKHVDGEESCIKMSNEADTIDLTDCDTSSWNCYDGIMDITNCQGSPFYLSYPHYYLADKQREMFEGLQPDAETHKTYLNVEPYTGMTLDIHNRIQLNTVLYNKTMLGIKGEFEVLENLKYFSTFPFLWLDLTASVTSDQEQVDKLKTQLVTPLMLLDVFSWLIIGVGIALTLLGGVIFVCAK